MIALLEVTNFSGSTTCPIIFSCLNIGYLNSLASLPLSIHTPNILTYFGYFLSFSRSLSTKKKIAKDADINSGKLGSACIRDSSIKDTNTEGVCITSTCARRFYI